MKRCLHCDLTFDGEGWQCPACGWQPEKRDDLLLFAPVQAGGFKGYTAARFARNAALEAGSFWFVARNRLIQDRLRRFCPSARNLLEIGCGTGFVLLGLREACPDLELAGSDMLVEGLQFASQRLPGVPLYQFDALDIPFRDHFDVIGAFDVIEHIEEDERVLEQCLHCLRPAGALLLTVPQHRWLWSGHDDNARHRRRYSRQELAAKVSRAGFEVEYSTSFMALLLPVMLASRLFKHGPSYPKEAIAELDLPRPLQFALGWVMTLERVLIRMGIRFPAGGSLLLIARKKSDLRSPISNL